MRARFLAPWLTAAFTSFLAACVVTQEQPAASSSTAPAATSSGGTVSGAPPSASGTAAAPVEQTVAVVEGDGLPADPPPPADGRYTILFERPSRVGVATAFEGRGEKRTRQRRRIGRTTPTDQTEILAVRIAGVHRVLEVDSTGDAVRTQIDVQSCTAEGTGQPEELIAAGSTIVIESAVRPARGRFLVNGRPAAPRVAEHLELLFSRSRSATSDDDVFGSRDRTRRVGESWAVQSARMASELADTFPGLRASDVRGRVTFHGIVQEGGRTFLDLGVDVSIRVRAMPNLPPGTRVTRGTMRMSPRGLFAVTEGVPAPRERTSSEAEFAMLIPTPAGQATLDMTITESRELTRR